ncbi:MAG: hypothetical protein WD469_08725 [Paenibacillaceae bacterium]
MPIFLSFVLVLNSFIQLTVAQIALQTAVSETTKQIATHMYPVHLLYTEAESKIASSHTGAVIQNVIDQIVQTRSKVTDSEDFVAKYTSYIPEPIVVLLEWEKKKRELLEAKGQDSAQQVLDQTFIPLINKAFTALVLQFADSKVIHSDQLRVVDVKLPNLALSSEAFIAIEAQYDISIPLPFFHRTLALRKRAVERVWVGS